VFVLALFTTAWLRRSGLAGEYSAALLQLHRSLGVTTTIVVVIRLGWRLRFAYLPPFPPSMPQLQQLIAKWNEFGLYAALLLQPLTGLARTLWRGRPFALFGLQVPALLPANGALSELFRSAHASGASVIFALVGLHALAALLHRLILRDKVLARMLP
jgi:cytochrome b561